MATTPPVTTTIPIKPLSKKMQDRLDAANQAMRESVKNKDSIIAHEASRMEDMQEAKKEGIFGSEFITEKSKEQIQTDAEQIYKNSIRSIAAQILAATSPGGMSNYLFARVPEEFINEIKPDVVYTNFIGDLNKDHRLVSEATMVACRPYKEHAPKEVWMYRIPGTTELGLREFKADRTELIDSSKKLELLLKWYPDELINGREVVDEYERFERWPRV